MRRESTGAGAPPASAPAPSGWASAVALGVGLLAAGPGPRLAADEAPPADAPAPEESAPAEATPSPSPTPSPEPPPADPVSPSPWSGFLKSRYQLRSSGDDRDQDLFEYLRVDVSPAVSSHVSAHVYGRLTVDVEGDASPDGPYVFDNINDINDSRVDTRLYEARVDATRLGPVSSLSAGRLISYDGPVFLYFDGLRAESRRFSAASGLQAGVLGGVPVHLFEASRSGDLIGGVYVGADPWRGGRVRLFGLHVDDASVTGALANNYLATTAWQHVGEGVDLKAEHVLVDGGHQNVELRGSYWRPAWDLRVQGWVFKQLRTVEQQAIEFDPFFVSLRSVYPYWQGRVAVGKGWLDHYGLDAGVSVRQLVYPEAESMYNHDVLQGWVAASVYDVGLEGLRADLTGEVWDSRTDDEAFWTLGGELGYRSGDDLDLAVGTSYALYKYDLYADTELDHVRTWFGRVRYDVFDQVKLDLAYNFEDAVDRRFHTLNLSLRYDL